jgi:hypothetical protein
MSQLVYVDPPSSFAAVLAIGIQEPELVRLWAMLTAEATEPEHPAHEYVVDWYERRRAETAQNLVTAQAAGVIDSEIDTINTAAVILATMDGLLLHWLLNSHLDIAAMFKPLISQLLPPPHSGGPW